MLEDDDFGLEFVSVYDTTGIAYKTYLGSCRVGEMREDSNLKVDQISQHFLSRVVETYT